jgi:outer membrane protein TolC
MFKTPRQSTSALAFSLICIILICAAFPAFAQEPAAEEPAAAPESDAEESEAEESEAEKFTLEELVELAISNDALVAEFKAKRAKAKWDQYKAEHITWMPSIRSTTLLSVVPDNANPDAFDRNIDQFADFNFGPFVRQDLDIVVPIYTFGKSSTAEKLAELGVENVGLEFENARLDSIFQTRRAYWSLRLSLAFQEMLDDGARIIGDQLDSMQEKRDFGGVDFDIKDFRKLEIFDAEVQSRIVDNQKLATLARAGLHFLADIPEDTRIGVEPLDGVDTPPQLQPREYYVERALGHRPELNQLDKAVQARQFQADLAVADWYPDLFAALRFGFSWSTGDTAFQRICAAPSLDAATECDFPEDRVQIDDEYLFAEPYGDPLHSLSLQIGVGLRWNLDPFQIYGDVQKAEAAVQVVRAQRRRAHEAVEFEIKKLYQDAADALKKIEINDRRLKAAERWRDQFGLSTQTAGADLADAVEPLKAFYEARAKYLQSIYDYRIARAELARAVGARDLEQDGSVAADVE